MQPQEKPSRDAPAVIILNDTRVDRHHGCSSVMRVLEAGLADAGFRIAATVPAHTDWEKDAGFHAALPTAQMLVVNGEGTLHHDRPAGLRLLQAGRFARERGIGSALVNAGWEANGKAYVEAARDFSLVSARDSRSAAALRSEGVACRVVPDLSLCTIPPSAVSDRDGIAFTDSVEPKVTLALDALRRKLGGEVLSIHEFDPQQDMSWRFLRAGLSRADLVHPLRIRGLLRARRAQWLSATCEIERFLRKLAGLDLLVSGRFHACTLALVVGTPFIATGSNTGKIAALVADAGLDGSRCTELPKPESIANARAKGWSDEERKSLVNYLRRARDEAADLFGALVRLLG